MAKSKRHLYETNRKAINRLTEEGEISEAESEAINKFLDAKDPEVTFPDHTAIHRKRTGH